MMRTVALGLGVLTMFTWLAACGDSAEASGAASQPTSPPVAGAAGLAQRIATAHGGRGWITKGNLEARIRVEIGGKTVVAGTMLHEPTSGCCRIDLQEGGTLVYDGTDAWVSPADLELPRARFHLKTWPYFLCAPWKLGDSRTTMSPAPKRKLKGVEFPTAKLTFEAGVGDTPDDWYVVYEDPTSHRLKALAYIVTYGTTAEEASAKPHLAMYEKFTDVDGLQVPSRLTFWNWNEEEGTVGDSIGNASFDDIKIVPTAAGSFARPENARKDELPR